MVFIPYFRSFALLSLAALLAAPAFAQDVPGRRKEALDQTMRILSKTSPKMTGRISASDRTWEDWIRRTGELPPDFDSMPSIPYLPDPLVLEEAGRKVPITGREQWNRKKQWIREQYEQWVFGRMPPAPGNLRAVVTRTAREGTVTVRDVRLEFGPGHRAALRLQLMIPDGKGPFPVFLTNHPRTRPWVATAVRRGYIGCIYFAADPIYGNDDDSDKFIEVYPEYDFSTLARWAWAGMRAVDYLYTMPEVDKAKIGITGHSRNGKQALLAAAFDDRIGAVIPSSGNTGEGTPWRYTPDMFRNETLEKITGNFAHWFHPRLRFFAGREHKLPVDQNLLMAMVAPRGLMLMSGFAEGQGAPFGFEQGYRSTRRVYEFLGHPERLALFLRAGEHPTTAGDLEHFMDFFDGVFGRGPVFQPETQVYGYTFDKWKKISGEQVDPRTFPARTPGDFVKGNGGKPAVSAAAWEEQKTAIRKKIVWSLGEEPPRVSFPVRGELSGSIRTTDGWLGILAGRPLKLKGAGSAEIAFGDDLKADLYYPLGPDGKVKPGKLPAVLWLHEYGHATGYSRDARAPFEELIRRGYAVLAFDQLGFGTRVLDSAKFYERYPKWSLMGKMVADTRAALDALAALHVIDAARITIVGYALGAKVGLYTAALDNRVHGVAAVAGFAPLRLDRPEKGTEGVAHYSHLHGLIPKFGFFRGEESRLPVDYDELLAMIAPRPVYVVAPSLDRYHPVADVKAAVEQSKKIYRLLGSEQALELDTPEDFNRFPASMQRTVFDWLP